MLQTGAGLQTLESLRPRPRQVRSRLATDFRAWQDEGAFEEQLQRVVKALRADEGGRPTAPASKR